MTNFFSNREDAGDPLLDRLRAATVGLYDVAGEIGRGGMAVVYIATDLRLGRRVAIKVMEPRLNFTPGMAERFLQEARIAAQLQHHNIIVVHEVQHDGELIFFVMRLVEGGSLDEICRRLAQKQLQIPIDQTQWILWQSARALAYAHSEGIIHRDVKPANILISTKGEVVVTDFGIAKAVDAEGLTKSGMAIGTPTYMSPEQFVGQDPLSGAADQYALGIAAYEMLTGAPPFTGDLYRIIAAHGSTPAPDVREKRTDCPAPLADAVMRMLAKSPADRWPSLDAALSVLGQGLAIDGSATRANLAHIAVELQTARAASVTAWSALTPVTPSWSSGSRRNKSSRPVPAAITVSPPNAQVVTGKQLHLRAVVTSDTGSTIGDAVVTWTSSNPTVATVTSDGAVTGLTAGSASIRAEVVVRDGHTGVVHAAAELMVTRHEVARVQILGGDQTIESGEASRLTAELFDEDGSPVELFDEHGSPVESATVNWASSDPDIVHVDARGTMLALAGGHAIVSARVGGVQGSVRIDVRATLVVATATELVLGSDAELSPPTSARPAKFILGSDTKLSAELVLGSDTKLSPELRLSPPPAAIPAELVLGSDTKLSPPLVSVRAEPGSKTAPKPLSPQHAAPALAAQATSHEPASWLSTPRVLGAIAAALVVVMSAGLLATRDSRPENIGSDMKGSSDLPMTSVVTDSVRVAPNANTPNTSGSATRAAVSGSAGTTAVALNRPLPNDKNLPVRDSTRRSPSVPPQARGSAASSISSAPEPPVAVTTPAVDAAATPTPTATRLPEVAGLSENEMRRLAREYVLRLERGEFRTGTLAGFFSGSTSSHRAAMVGAARIARRDGDELLVDVDLELERTMGSGAVQRRATSVRLVLRGRPGVAVIESATPGLLINAR